MKIHSNTSFRNFSATFDLRFSAIDSVESELIGVVKVEGGIEYLIRHFMVINSDYVLREIHERGIFSARPYQLGQACDGSITACVLALFYRFCQERGELPNELLRAAFPTQQLEADWTDIVATAEWQGVVYALSPIFVGMLMFPSVEQIGRRYLLNLVGIMIWPLGWGVAGLITQGMISFMTDQSFLSSQSAGGDLGYSLQNLMGLAFLGIWIIFSTIAAPVIIQRAIATGSSVGSDLLSGSFAAGSAAGMAGMMSMAGMRGNSGSGGGKLAAIKNAVMSGAFGGAIASATAAETLVAASMNEGRGGGSLIGSLVQMNRKSSTFPPDDPSGDKTVDDMIRDSKNSKT